MGAYLLVCKNKTAEEAWSYFQDVEPKFKPFRDAIYGDCTYPCTVSYEIILLDLRLFEGFRVRNETRMVQSYYIQGQRV